jgi:adenine deaminase
MLRQGSAARNLLNLLPAVNAFTAPFCFLATDDRHTEDLLHQGHINYLLRLAVGEGKLDPIQALRLATLHGPRHYGLRDLGAIAPGFKADLALFPNLEEFRPARVWKDGRLAAENGCCLWPPAPPVDESRVRTGLKLGPVTPETFRVPATGARLRVIGLHPGELVTDHLVLTPAPAGGCFAADPAADLAKMAVFERHRGSGHVALGFLKGLGIKCGALATTIAHDSHNLAAAGVDDADMALAVEEIRRLGGGLAVAANGRVLGSLPLPLGGLLSDRPLAEIGSRLAALQEAVRGLGLAEGFDPFMSLAFMSLPVIPSLKLTEAGLVDVNRFEIVPLVF